MWQRGIYILLISVNMTEKERKEGSTKTKLLTKYHFHPPKSDTQTRLPWSVHMPSEAVVTKVEPRNTRQVLRCRQRNIISLILVYPS